MPRLALCLLILGAPAPAASRGRLPTTGVVSAPAPSTARWVAKRKGRSKAGKAAKQAEPVKLRTQVTATTLTKGRTSSPAFMVEPDRPLELETSDPGKLTLTLHAVLSAKAKKAVNVRVTIDGKSRDLVLAAAPVRGVGLFHDRKAEVGRPNELTEILLNGVHRVRIEISGKTGSAVAGIELFGSKSKTPAPIIEELLPQEGPAGGGTPAAAPPSEVASAPSPPPPAAAAPAAAAAAPLVVVEVEATPSPAAPAAQTMEPAPMSVAERVAAGEIRHGRLRTFPEVTLLDARSGESVVFQRIAGEVSYIVAVAGPGELTIQVHRLMDPAQEREGSEFSLVIIENDVVLQQLGGVTKRSEVWSIQDPGPEALQVSETKECRLKFAAKQATIEVQIAGAPEGMLIRDEFAAEELGLAGLSLSLSDDDEDDGEDGAFTAIAAPTIVREVVVDEHLAPEEGPDYLSARARAGVLLPLTGGRPGFAGGAELAFVAPFLERIFSVGLQVDIAQHEIVADVAHGSGVAVATSSAIIAVPILARVEARYAFTDTFAVLVSGAAGVAFVSVQRNDPSGAAPAGDRWIWALRAGAGTELEVGPGWLGLEGAYLAAQTEDYGEALHTYSPSGVLTAATYRVEF